MYDIDRSIRTRYIVVSCCSIVTNSVCTHMLHVQSLLPFKPVLLPVVFRYARGMPVEHWMFSERMARQEDSAGGGKALMNFMEGHFPEFHRHHDAAELKRWWSSSEPRILVVGPSSSSLAAKAKDFMPVFRLAHVWEEFFDIASADAQVMVEVLGSDFAFERGQTWALVLRSSSGAITKEHVRNVRDMAPLIQDFISEEIQRQAPVATVRNYQQLCGDKALSQGTSKTYCLILVDASTEDTVKALRELESSQKAYYQEVQELRNTGEDSEEPFRIQPIRVASSSSRLPWKPAAPGPSFASIWAEASEARVFVLEMETRKFAAVKTPSLNEIFQNIAYEDLKLEDLHDEGPPLSRLFSDPETTLRREVSAFLSTSRGAICAYVLVALVVSVAPELELLQLAVPMVILVLVMMLASPTLFRKVISIFWCTMSSSRMECQRNF
ncbi:SET domain-containing protein 8 [Durusdinium trenchii]|uniref:SET domain-containing protein 8 n=1 Tax=Durusdinium trenchii TaxID=1381693 RepID=A0ABP0RDY8_9DINO